LFKQSEQNIRSIRHIEVGVLLIDDIEDANEI